MTTEATIVACVRDRLRQEYRGVLPHDPHAFEQLLEERFSFALRDDQLAHVRAITASLSDARVLDVGCGYGTFVLACLRHGYDARGIDVAEFELEIARTRLRSAGFPADPNAVFQIADATRTHLPDRAFDVITCWSVLEHTPRYIEVLREADRLVRPGGFVLITAPNYCAFRREAHYQVPWVPMLPKTLAVRYLRFLHRDPTFLRDQVHFVTNWGVIAWFLRNGYRLHFRGTARTAWKQRVLRMIRAVGGDRIARGAVTFAFLNPFRSSIVIAAQKPP